MTTRTTKSMVTFMRPFNLTGFDGEQPAGSYSVETDEELLEGVSFPAYRRMATMMQLDAPRRGSAGVLQVAVINPDELAAALAADAGHTPDGDEFASWRAMNMPGAADPKS
jgi:hypothetical protein